MQLRQIVAHRRTPITEVFFVESGIVSMIAESPDDRIEIGVVGREGATTAGAAFGATQHPHTIMCQSPGDALSIRRDDLEVLVGQSPSIAVILGRYLHYLAVQIGQAAYANASMNIEARLARWILMTDDRTDKFELNLTHEFLSVMLGARRPSVTSAIHVLEGAKMIRAERATITITDRSKLEYIASDAYGLAETEYERLFGVNRSAEVKSSSEAR
ncbi:MAG TPA: Crp/Fnr family transcriptional regulator [Devosia sp.]|nr:Crp/Fnr family transcriptional regulator [Devosia sp.]